MDIAPAILPILRSPAQGRILAVVMEARDSLSIGQIAQLSGVSQSIVSREVARAALAGLFLTTENGNKVDVRINSQYWLLRPLRELISASFGAPSIVAKAFSDITNVERIFLFGSWVERYNNVQGSAPNDIDILIIGQPNRSEVDAAADHLESRLGLSVNPTVRSIAQWSAPRGSDPFIDTVKSRPLLEVPRVATASQLS